MAQLKTPDAQNNIPIKGNKTAEVSAVCHKLEGTDYSIVIHSTCYSEMKQAVVVVVTGNANGITGKQILKFITGEYEKVYVPAVGYWQFPERPKTTVLFLLNGITYGPYSGQSWQDGFKEVRGHTTEAWFKKRN